MKANQIEFHSENAFELQNASQISAWMNATALSENKHLGALNIIFCSDEYLHKINVEFLQHDYYTDIISFDYSVGSELIGDLYISTERVDDNSKSFGVAFEEELHRVLIHGLLHLCGYKDKTAKEATLMREKENYYLSLRA